MRHRSQCGHDGWWKDLERRGWSMAAASGPAIGGFLWPSGDDLDAPWIRSPIPGPLALMDPKRVGFVRISAEGEAIDSWGLALCLQGVSPGDSVLQTPFGSCFLDALAGEPCSRLVGAFRCLASRAGDEVAMLLVEAEEEEEQRRRARQSEKTADLLTRLSRSLSLHHSVRPLCQSTLPAIVDGLGLAAAMIWVRGSDHEPWELAASHGVDPGAAALIMEEGRPSAARLAVSQAQPLFLHRLEASPLTAALEGELLGETASGLFVSPLLASGQVIGALEMIGKAGDTTFAESRPLLGMIAEHLGLALNGALRYEHAEKLAAFDALTGIPNHRTLQQYLKSRVSEAQREGTQLGVVMLDVDHFRRFNEEEGHDAGDDVLKLVAGALRASLRGYDLAARYGGEEFTLVLPGAGEKETFEAAERVRASVEAIRFRTRQGEERRITASLGCAVMPSAASAPEHLLKAADLALYQAKRNGRNRTEMHRPEFGSLADSRSLPSLETIRSWPIARELPRPEEASAVLAALCAAKGETGLAPALQASLLLASAWLDTQESRDQVRAALSREGMESSLAALELIEERWDGQGPKELEAEAIPTAARILASAACAAGLIPFDNGRLDPSLWALASQIAPAA